MKLAILCLARSSPRGLMLPVKIQLWQTALPASIFLTPQKLRTPLQMILPLPPQSLLSLNVPARLPPSHEDRADIVLFQDAHNMMLNALRAGPTKDLSVTM